MRHPITARFSEDTRAVKAAGASKRNSLGSMRFNVRFRWIRQIVLLMVVGSLPWFVCIWRRILPRKIKRPWAAFFKPITKEGTISCVLYFFENERIFMQSLPFGEGGPARAVGFRQPGNRGVCLENGFSALPDLLPIVPGTKENPQTQRKCWCWKKGVPGKIPLAPNGSSWKMKPLFGKS